jgi:hypothetical protein
MCDPLIFVVDSVEGLFGLIDIAILMTIGCHHHEVFFGRINQE